MKRANTIPFDFVLWKLASRHPVIKPMFGCHAIYLGEKIMLILRKKENFPADNGVWIATTHDHHQSLKNDFPSLRPIGIFGTKDSAWQNLPEEAADFEESVTNVCERILKNDIRIGKIPVKKKIA